MNTKHIIPFNVEVLNGLPILIITPYGFSAIEIMNIIIESLKRSNIDDLYIDRDYMIDDSEIPIYKNGAGIILMTNIADNILYNKSIVPIFIAQWNIRKNDIKRYSEWIYPNNYISLFPTFISPKKNPNIYAHVTNISLEQYIIANENHKLLNITYDNKTLSLSDTNINDSGWISIKSLNNLKDYSPKISLLINYIKSPCVIYCPYKEKYGLDFIDNIIKLFEIHTYRSNKKNLFTTTRFGILLIDNINDLNDIPSNIPIHIINFDSSHGMDLIINHEIIHIYLCVGPNNESTSELIQYNLFEQGINDANNVYKELISFSKLLTIDKYNNLYITQNIK